MLMTPDPIGNVLLFLFACVMIVLITVGGACILIVLITAVVVLRGL